ncbi:MAG: hypothetical protein ABI690_19260 [Chloroflexota bacterium]
MVTAEEIIVRSLKRTRDYAVGAGGVLVVMTIFFFGIAFLGWHPPIFDLKGETQRLVIGGILTLVSGGLLVFTSYQLMRQFPGLDIRQSPIIKAVTKEPGKIVWIYEYLTQYKSRTFRQIYVCLSDGHRYQLNANFADASEVLMGLSAIAPDARVGYSHEREKLYKEDPAAFKFTSE